MPELKTIPQSPFPARWLPSLDLHEEDGELVLHAHLRGFGQEDVLISLEGNDLVITSPGERDALACCGRLSLPFAPQALRTVTRPGHEDLEVRISIETAHE
ncbi:MAG TPA: Hsp20/alpha crystallin family protein [Thermoanaerobaculia bacterium]|nr:Hsp20/alpha crystallin family protein [Thermoanaerobaculia bacterium]